MWMADHLAILVSICVSLLTGLVFEGTHKLYSKCQAALYKFIKKFGLFQQSTLYLLCSSWDYQRVAICDLGHKSPPAVGRMQLQVFHHLAVKREGTALRNSSTSREYTLFIFSSSWYEPSATVNLSLYLHETPTHECERSIWSQHIKFLNRMDTTSDYVCAAAKGGRPSASVFVCGKNKNEPPAKSWRVCCD